MNMTLFQVSGICIFQILKLFVNNFRAIFWSSVLPNNEREGWWNHCHHLEITLVIKIYGTDSILLQDCTQFPDQFFWMNVQSTTDSYSRETKDLQPGKKNRKNKPQDFSFIDERRNWEIRIKLFIALSCKFVIALSCISSQQFLFCGQLMNLTFLQVSKSLKYSSTISAQHSSIWRSLW